jgi:hypothetical protein
MPTYSQTSADTDKELAYTCLPYIFVAHLLSYRSNIYIYISIGLEKYNDNIFSMRNTLTGSFHQNPTRNAFISNSAESQLILLAMAAGIFGKE